MLAYFQIVIFIKREHDGWPKHIAMLMSGISVGNLDDLSSF